MLQYLKKFERGIVGTLIGLLMLVLLFSVVELGWILLKDIFTPPIFLLEIEELLTIFGFFLLVLIGLEIIGSIRSYLEEGVVHVEVVVTVAIIALARKVIILEPEHYQGTTLIGIGVIFTGLAITYYLIKQGRSMR